MSKIVLPILLVVLVVVGALYYFQRGDVNLVTPEIEIPGAVEEITIKYTDEGYMPKSLTIKKEAEVIFRNESSRDTWPASAMHPTHRVYPQTDIDRCGKVAENTMFDACRGLKPGESWSFKFDQIGTWGYHDHLNPRHFGSVTVE